MWNNNDSSRIMKWNRSPGIVNGTLMSDDNIEFVICDELTN